ncbi:hypothetical protein ACFYTQ_28090 [Nocardia sp. NPDC004068]|uniref:hypothetical protein n=1 Tax=Nocardia sp. NPDC004068 TaxID=3364303 RepID=UPI0036B3B978
MNSAIVDTIVSHMVRGDDLGVLTDFAARHVTHGYETSGPWEAGEGRWEVLLSQSLASDLGREEIEARCAAAGLTYMGTATEHLMHDTATHDSQGVIKLSAKLGGSVYVSVCDKYAKTVGRVWLRSPDTCNHGVTICHQCAESWEIDYDVLYSKTQAGRKLSQQRADTRPTPAPPFPAE